MNRLGSTETGTIRWHFLDHDSVVDDTYVPVGYPVERSDVVLRDDTLEPVPIGEVGEITIRSRFLSPGYWKNDAATAAAFLPDPEGGDRRLYRTGDLGRMAPDGCLVHVGRRDHQVKVRGYRVELGEVESALRNLPSVHEAIVMPHGREGQLVAYFEPVAGRLPTASLLRRSLERTLPGYMVPASFVRIDRFPLAANGKINRGALPPPSNSRPDLDVSFRSANSVVERELVGIWAEVLGVQEIGVDDPFFESYRVSRRPNSLNQATSACA